MSSGADDGAVERHPLLATQAFSVLEGVLAVQSEQQAGAARLHMVRRFFRWSDVDGWPRPNIVGGEARSEADSSRHCRSSESSGRRLLSEVFFFFFVVCTPADRTELR